MMWPPRPPAPHLRGRKGAPSVASFAGYVAERLRGVLREAPASPPGAVSLDRVAGSGLDRGGGIRRPLRPGGFPFRRTGSRIRAAPSPASLRSAAGRLPLGRRPLRPRAHGGRGTLDPPFAAPIGSPRIRRSAGDRAGTPTARGVCARRKRGRADRRAALRRRVRADWPGGTLSGRICRDIFHDALDTNRS